MIGGRGWGQEEDRGRGRRMIGGRGLEEVGSRDLSHHLGRYRILSKNSALFYYF